MNKETFKKQHMIDLKGRDYLPVAPRVVLFRQEHPDYSILTESKTIGEDIYVRAMILDEQQRVLSTAHKRVKKGGRGPAAEWPLETAETGAVGRALALLGYGTLSGDLDEGDQIADAPVEREATPAEGAQDIVGAYEQAIRDTGTIEELRRVAQQVKRLAKGEARDQLAAMVRERKAFLEGQDEQQG